MSQKTLLDRLRQARQLKRIDNRIVFRHLKSAQVVKEFVTTVVEIKRDGYKKIILDFTKVDPQSYYTNVLVPLAAFCENTTKSESVEFVCVGGSGIAELTNFLVPKSAGLTDRYPSVLNRVWKFNAPEDVFKLVTDYMDAIYQTDVFEKDVLTAIEWCLNEVMDNVIQHAEVDYGYIMGQVHPKTKMVVFCIADAGQGILASLLSSGSYTPKNATDAITLALREGVTRDRTVGQGNGLWGLHQIVHNNSGTLNVSSAGASIETSPEGEGIRASYVWLNRNRGGTVIDFRLDYSQTVSISSILKGQDGTESMKIFHATNNDGTIVHYKLRDKRSGYGTRKSGERIRKEVINLMHESGLPVDVDFSGVGIVSSSFADEFIGKLFLYMGPLKFNQFIRMTNMNESVEAIVNKAMKQRLKDAVDEE